MCIHVGGAEYEVETLDEDVRSVNAESLPGAIEKVSARVIRVECQKCGDSSSAR